MKSLLAGAAVLLGGAALVTASEYTNETDPYYGMSPPVYPTPLGNGTTSPQWAAAYAKARALVSQMTLVERSNLTYGHGGMCVGNTGAVPRLNVPALCFSDAPDGVRGQEFVSAFPAGIHVAATWDRELMYQYGHALGSEYRGKGINVALGPVAGPLGRVARGGRNWEGLSSDPYLAGAGVGEITRGMQEAGTMACMKHWLLNEQEWRRMPTEGLGEAISENVDDRTLHELYVFPFMNSLREGVASVMCSYQRANNSYACQNSKLLNGVLKGELGFEGFVVSDWGAQHSGVASANAGLDLVMPSEGFWGDALVEAVTNRSVSEDRLTDMATRILASWYYTNQDEGYPDASVYAYNQQHAVVDVQMGHRKLIREIGAAGTVLVKNVNSTLPLKSPKFLSIYGYDATVKGTPWDNPSRYGGGYEVNFGWNTFNGTLITGGGSGSNAPPYVVSPFQAIQERIAADGGILRWDFYSQEPSVYYANSEACLVFINAYASESFDRTSLTDDFSDGLVTNVAGNCSNTIVVIHSAGIRTVPWISHPNITAVLFAGLPGQESGHSLVDVLYGDVNPSGKLPYTIAKREEDYPVLNSSVSFDSYPQNNFTEGLFIDYRAFDANNMAVEFEFGFGLSYTTFEISGLKISTVDDKLVAGTPDPEVEIVQGGHPALWETVARVSVEVKNLGDVSGAEVPQVYVGIPVDGTPVRQLRGFEKVDLRPGESKTITFALTRRDVSYWDVVAQQWTIPSGEFGVWVGASSRNLPVNGTFTVEQ